MTQSRFTKVWSSDGKTTVKILNDEINATPQMLVACEKYIGTSSFALTNFEKFKDVKDVIDG